jgi:hypothetical protein
MPKVDISTPEGRAAHDLDLGRRYPYHGKRPKDWAEAAALAICANLSDRAGIKHKMRQTSDETDQQYFETCAEMVESFAEIIRYAQERSKYEQER